jgi:hypothetical protein
VLLQQKELLQRVEWCPQYTNNKIMEKTKQNTKNQRFCHGVLYSFGGKLFNAIAGREISSIPTV